MLTCSINVASSLAVTVTGDPSSTGFGEAETQTNGFSPFASSSLIVTCTESGVPAVTPDGRPDPRDTVKVSWSAPESCIVVIVPVPVVSPAAIVMEVSDPTSSDSAAFGEPVETVTGMLRALECGVDSVAVTVTGDPSSTGLGEAESETDDRTASSSWIVTCTELGVPAESGDGSVPSATVNVSWSASSS